MNQTAARIRRTPLPKTYRFDARLNEEQKVLIQRAADLEGRTMTDFVIHSAEAAAGETIEARHVDPDGARNAGVCRRHPKAGRTRASIAEGRSRIS
jgi:hypothetical protein